MKPLIFQLYQQLIVEKEKPGAGEIAPGRFLRSFDVYCSQQKQDIQWA